MNEVTRIVHEGGRHIIPPQHQMGSIMTSLFLKVNAVHRLWRWHRQAVLYSNPQNFLQLSTGFTINFLVGDRLPLRVAAQCLLISQRILAAIKQKTTVAQSCQHVMDVWRGCYISQPQTSWSFDAKNHFLSPSTSNEWLYSFKRLANQIHELSRSVFDVFVQLFKLSMYTMDAIDVFYLSPETRNESVNEMFVNATQLLDELVGNKEFLLKGLNDNKEVIEEILMGVRAPLKADQLINSVAKTLAVASTTKSVKDRVGKSVVNFTKQVGFEFLSLFGLRHIFSDFDPDDNDVVHITSFKAEKPR